MTPRRFIPALAHPIDFRSGPLAIGVFVWADGLVEDPAAGDGRDDGGAAVRVWRCCATRGEGDEEGEEVVVGGVGGGFVLKNVLLVVVREGGLEDGERGTYEDGLDGGVWAAGFGSCQIVV